MTRSALLLFLLATTAEVWTSGGGYSTATLQADGGVALEGALILDASGARCACSSGASCSAPAPDGGRGPAPLGVTLHGPTGSGCVTKPCVELSGQPSWDYDACPCPSALPDGGGGC